MRHYNVVRQQIQLWYAHRLLFSLSVFKSISEFQPHLTLNCLSSFLTQFYFYILDFFIYFGHISPFPAPPRSSYYPTHSAFTFFLFFSKTPLTHEKQTKNSHQTIQSKNTKTNENKTTHKNTQSPFFVDQVLLCVGPPYLFSMVLEVLARAIRHL